MTKVKPIEAGLTVTENEKLESMLTYTEMEPLFGLVEVRTVLSQYRCHHLSA